LKFGEYTSETTCTDRNLEKQQMRFRKLDLCKAAEGNVFLNKKKKPGEEHKDTDISCL